jgi:ABC-type iron transport system FetAB permease component
LFILAGSGVVIAAMLATGTLQPDIVMLVPVGSMIIANAMNDRGTLLRGCHGHVGEIEAGLALGAEPATAVAPSCKARCTPACCRASILLKSLELVWIPGVMAGMVVSGARPEEADGRHLSAVTCEMLSPQDGHLIRPWRSTFFNTYPRRNSPRIRPACDC